MGKKSTGRGGARHSASEERKEGSKFQGESANQKISKSIAHKARRGGRQGKEITRKVGKEREGCSDQ